MLPIIRKNTRSQGNIHYALKKNTASIPTALDFKFLITLSTSSSLSILNLKLADDEVGNKNTPIIHNVPI